MNYWRPSRCSKAGMTRAPQVHAVLEGVVAAFSRRELGSRGGRAAQPVAVIHLNHPIECGDYANAHQ